MTLGNTAKSDSELITSAIDKLRALRSEMVDAPDAAGDAIPAGGSPLISATNLMHYGMLRRHDLRELQVCLAKHGVTHFSQIESDVLKTIDAVIHLLTPDKEPTAREQKWPIDLEIAQQILDSRTSTLYGEDETGRDVRIMVTLPTEAADDYRLVREMVAAGTNAVRINCAQGRKKSWAKMIANVRKAEKDCGRACRIMMDLAGPKLRTGPMVVGRKYARIRPEREDDGLQVRPAHIWLAPNEAPPVEVPRTFVHLPVEREWVGRLSEGDTISLRDMRGRKRKLRVREILDNGCWATLKKGALIETGCTLTGPTQDGEKIRGVVGELPATQIPVVLKAGEPVIIRRKKKAARPARRHQDGSLLRPASFSCTLPEVLDVLAPGDHVGFDDGMAEGLVEEVSERGARILVTRTESDGVKLHAGKSINFPERALSLPAVTSKDRQDLAFIVEHADIVGASYFKNPDDLCALQQALRDVNGQHLGILLKIENRSAFENMTPLLLELLKWDKIGLLIARGDMAVECGMDNIAEVQEEILRFGAAAHIPVLIATQILESQSKRGLASRAEIIDVTSASRAQCILLNKGPYIIESIRLLDRLLRRIQDRRPNRYSDLGPMAADALFERNVPGES